MSELIGRAHSSRRCCDMSGAAFKAPSRDLKQSRGPALLSLLTRMSDSRRLFVSRSLHYFTRQNTLLLILALLLSYFLFRLAGQLFTPLSPDPPPFRRIGGSEDLKCPLLFQTGHDDYVKQLGLNRRAIRDHEISDGFAMDCDSIRSRHYFNPMPKTQEEADYPLAFARLVFTDYYFVELSLSVMYHPQNWYCYAIDSTAAHAFKYKMNQLASCFPNVLISPTERDADGMGHNVTHTQLDCMELLKDKPWNYISLLENHDFPGKTNFEMVRIFKWLKGANDLEHTTENGRIDKTLNWTLEHIALFKNESLYPVAHARAKAYDLFYPPEVTFAKGYSQSSLSRPMVDFVLSQLNIRDFVNRMDDKKWAYTSEMVWQTLNSLELLQVPGGYTQKCLRRGIRTGHITRMSTWHNRHLHCKSGKFRHVICIFGVEDLRVNLATSPHLFINKLMSDVDFSALTCWAEWIYNRTHFEKPTDNRLFRSFYEALGHVRFQELRGSDGIVPPKSINDFRCPKGDEVF